MMHKTLAIIPARGGSKGLPRKNVLLLAGKPLLYHTILAAKHSANIQDIVVSTDDDEIAQFADSEKITVIHRPPEIATDSSPTIDTILHAIQEVKKHHIHPDTIVLLQPTSPLRTSEDIDNALSLYKKSVCDSVISVTPAPHPPYWDMIIEDPYLKPIFNPDYLRKRRQDLPMAYMPNGAIYISSPDYLKKERSFYGERVIPYIMPADRSIDIDSEMDLLLAELIIQRKGIRDESNTDCR
ncbi:N-acylneuraminate cytidylyltransferase [anaerobic digester metagenome]